MKHNVDNKDKRAELTVGVPGSKGDGKRDLEL
jgi:hypothetical protein